MNKHKPIMLGWPRLLPVMISVCLAGCTTQTKLSAGDASFQQARTLIAQGQDAQAMQMIESLIKQYPENPQYRNWQKLLKDKQRIQLLMQADQLLSQEKFEASRALFQQILNEEPSNLAAADGLKKVGKAQQHAQQFVEAKDAVKAKRLSEAEYILRSILSEDAQHGPARMLFEQIEQHKNITSIVMTPLQAALSKKVTLELKNTPIRQAFAYLGKAGNLNFILDAEVSDSIQVYLLLRDTPLEKALDAVLTSYQLGKKTLSDNTVLIYPLHRVGQYQELYVRSFYLTNLDAKRAMNLVKTILHVNDVYIDEKLNTLVMRDTLEHIKVAEKLIAAQDLNEPEVMLEVEVMEVNRRNLEQLGIQYPGQIGLGVQGNAQANSTGRPTAGQLSLTELRNFNGGLGVFSVTDPAILLNMLHQDTDTNLLASPKIRVKNREKAKIHVGDKIPVLTSIANAQGFVSQNVNYIEVGIKLDVEPVIQMQDQVSIKVGMEVSNITDKLTTSNGVVAYTIGSRNANTTLQLKNNETQILAGLFRDDAQTIKRQVPGLSSLPIIGSMFNNNNQDKRKNEIVLLITPRILHNLSPANAVYTLIPSGVAGGNAATNPAGKTSSSSPSPSSENAVPPVTTPQSAQSDNSKADSGFANQMMSPASNASQP